MTESGLIGSVESTERADRERHPRHSAQRRCVSRRVPRSAIPEIARAKRAGGHTYFPRKKMTPRLLHNPIFSRRATHASALRAHGTHTYVSSLTAIAARPPSPAVMR